MNISMHDEDTGVEAVKPIIVNRALHYYRTLPTQVQRRLDLEDWIGTGISFYCSAFVRRAARRFDASQTKYTTYVWKGFDNFYRQLVWEQSCKQMEATTCSIEELVGEGVMSIADAEARNFTDVIDAVSKVRRLHSQASIELVKYLDKHFFSCNHTGRTIVKGAKFREKQNEFLHIANRLGVTIEDYRLAIQAHHAVFESTWK